MAIVALVVPGVPTPDCRRVMLLLWLPWCLRFLLDSCCTPVLVLVLVLCLCLCCAFFPLRFSCYCSFEYCSVSMTFRVIVAVCGVWCFHSDFLFLFCWGRVGINGVVVVVVIVDGFDSSSSSSSSS